MKVAIIGGGASGLACAVEAMREAKKNNIKLDITIFEKNDRVGKKLLSTGNGRCNMTNLGASAEDYFEASSFVSPALSIFPPKSNIDFFESLGMFTRADDEGRVYPLSNQASGVLDVLRFACESFGVKFSVSEKIENVAKKDGMFILNRKYKFDKLVISAGSKASLKEFNGYELLKQLSHKITETAPSLVKLSTKAAETKQLKGLRAAVELTLKISNQTVTKEKGEILFADNVLSGIAAMQLSAYISRHFIKSRQLPVVYVDFVSDFDYEKLVNLLEKVARIKSNEKCENLLTGFMPKKIGEVVLKKAGISISSDVADLDKKAIRKIASVCKSYAFEIDGVKSFAEAQVVTGGADLGQFNPKTLESKKVKGLYCCGEILDVDGLCGGYNLQWAWSSGRLCARSLVKEN